MELFSRSMIMLFTSIIFSIVTLFSTGVTALEKNPPATINKALVLQLVNNVRKKGCQCGDTYYNPAQPLVWNDKLEQAALIHSIDMQERNYFSHASPEGSRAGDRLDQIGYKWKAFGENIGMGYRNENEVVQGWIKSPNHCKNIMNNMFKEMGLARSGNYWTQTFGAR